MPLQYLNGVVKFWGGVYDKVENEVQYGLKKTNEFIDNNIPDPIVNTLDAAADVAQKGYSSSPVGKLDEGAAVAGQNVTDATGVPALGMATGMLLGMVDGSPGITVKNGSVKTKFLTQDQFATQQPARINKVRDQLDEANTVIKNIEEVNPGVSSKELSLKNKEYKAAKKVQKNKAAQVSSEESNILAPGPGREQAYPPSKPRAKQMKTADLARRGTIEALELHHKLPKGISAGFFNRVRDFIQEGTATNKDLERLAKKAQKAGMEAGDIEQNMLPMSKKPHNQFHTEMRAQGSNQFPGANLEIKKGDLTKRLRNVKNMKELESLWDDFLDDDGKYIYQTAEIWEELDALIKSIQQ